VSDNQNWLPILPADCCTICQTPHEKDGYRLIATSTMGFGFDDTLPDSIEDQKTPTTELINFYGSADFMQAEIFKLADTYCKSGLRPWGCMKCFGQVCKKCGSPLTTPSDAYHIDDKGNLVDAPKITGSVSCSCRNCSEYSNSR
jgi:hypothetical protein